VEAQRERLLQDGRCEGVVDDGDQVVFFGESDGFFQIDEAKSWVGGRFDVENFASRSDQALYSFERSGDVAHGNAHVGEDITHQAIGAAVELRGGDDFVALFQ